MAPLITRPRPSFITGASTMAGRGEDVSLFCVIRVFMVVEYLPPNALPKMMALIIKYKQEINVVFILVTDRRDKLSGRMNM